MIGTFFDLLGGWKEVRAYAGFSYQASRKGKRRIVPIEGWRNRGLADHQWVDTGTFADDRISVERFRDYQHMTSRAKPKRARLAKVDFAYTR
jgi:hypothetical protein